MPTETGIWNQEEADESHIFSYYLARWISYLFTKDKPITDIGCGRGTYLRYLQEKGFKQLKGIEGFKLHNFEFAYIGIKDLTDIIAPIDGQIGNVICLEVIEHIPKEYQDHIFNHISNHTVSDCYAVISCAIPGQGGVGHVNCMPNLIVMQEMEKRGFIFDLYNTVSAREVIENHCRYFRETLLIFKKR